MSSCLSRVGVLRRGRPDGAGTAGIAKLGADTPDPSLRVSFTRQYRFEAGPAQRLVGRSEEGPRSDLRGGISEACRTGHMPPRRGRQRRPAPAHPPIGRQWPTAIRYCAELNEITVTNVSAPGVSVSPIDYRGPGSVPDQQFLPRTIHHARDQELTWAQIGELLNTTAATAARRYRNKP